MKKNLSDINPAQLRGRVVLVRTDLNVPLEDGRVTDDQRIRASLLTLRLLSEAGARVVVLSHLGRPKGGPRPEFSLAPVAEHLSDLLARPIPFIGQGVGAEVEAAVARLEDGDLVLLENTRFLAGDTANDPDLAASWAALGDLFVNDAFGAAHRAHASTSGLADAMIARGGEAVAGLLLERELEYLEDALLEPERPFVAVLGGAKISGKIEVIAALLRKVDRLLIGGAMANTFLRAMGLDTGRSLVEEDRVDMAKDIMRDAGERLVLPLDCVVADEIERGAPTRVVARDAVQPDDRIGDIGPKTIEHFAEQVRRARTVVWNGPMGVFEIDVFAEGTMSLARTLAEACEAGALGVIGGGDSGAAAEKADVAERITHISTGGGASLELLAGVRLPGVVSLSEA
ncbi:MAG: phosphoglycerate kinase [Gemmatimonadota bacterium]